jgi:hypothetical protein
MNTPATRPFFQRMLVYAMIGCLFMFAIFLKVSPGRHILSGSSSPQVKIWADPDQPSDTHTKIAPLPVIILAFLVCFALRPEVTPGRIVTPSRFTPKTLFLSSRHWFRPPPVVVA